MRKPLIIFLLVWPVLVMYWRNGYESTLLFIVPRKYHEVMAPWHLWVYPWGFNGPYKESGPYIKRGGCREAGLNTLHGYMSDWPNVNFNGARFTCSQRCQFKIEHTDVRVCARVTQYDVSGAPVRENGI